MYLTCATPDSLSLALSMIVTGLDVCQPAQPPVHAIDVLGAAPSGSTANEVGSDTRPALFVAVTSLGSVGFAALEPKL